MEEKNNPEYCMRVLDRTLELLDPALGSHHHRHRLKEIARTRESLPVDGVPSLKNQFSAQPGVQII